MVMPTYSKTFQFANILGNVTFECYILKLVTFKKNVSMCK